MNPYRELRILEKRLERIKDPMLAAKAELTRSILKSPRFAGTPSALRNWYTLSAPFAPKTSSRNTTITCTVCGGSRLVAKEHDRSILGISQNLVDYVPCPQCCNPKNPHGKGRMSNNAEAPF
jgi:hypothetical protein